MARSKNTKRIYKRDFKEKREDVWRQDQDGEQMPSGKEGQNSNADFEEYYQKQQIVPEGEWDTFLTTLRTALPTTFRINGSGKFAADLRDRLAHNFLKTLGYGAIRLDDDVLQPPKPLPWYPDNLAWHFNFSRSQLRKMPALELIHEMMKRENDAGTITRQEAVSMIPPLLMDVQSHHKVLDTCAAPGSKTAQLLEMLHNGSTSPTGFVIANDADAQRCNMLAHQTKRICSPAMLITNHDATRFPLVGAKNPKLGSVVQYDRILCDVPCSGDGTIRKASDIWRRWSPVSGNGIHALQLRIALQSATLLKVGGRMVYSTCSFNPVEDEAVVAEMLRRSAGGLELVDVSEQLPALKRQQGKAHWVVKDKSGYRKSYAEVEQDPHHKLVPSIFPQEDVKTMHIERCMRVLPHHTEGGGFFVAVLHKTAEFGTDWSSINPTRPPRQEPEGKRAKATTQQQATASHTGSAASVDMQADAPASADKHAQLHGCAQEAADATQEFANAIGRENMVQAGAAAADAATATEEAAVSYVDSLKHAGQAPHDTEAAKPTWALQGASAGSGLGGSTAPAKPAVGLDGAEAMLVEAAAAGGGPASAQPATATEAAHVAAFEAAPPLNAANADIYVPDKRPADADTSEQPSHQTANSVLPDWGPRGGGCRGRTGGGRFGGLDPVTHYANRHSIDSIVDFFGIKPSLPLYRQLVARSPPDMENPKRLYFVAGGLRDLLQVDEQEQLKVTACGLKILERQEFKDASTDCRYRISQEGLPLVLPHVTKQLLRLSPPDFMRLLTERNCALPDDAKRGLSHPPASPTPAAPGPASAPSQPPSDTAASSPPNDTEATAAQPGQGGGKPVPNKIPLTDPDLLKQLNGVLLGCCICLLRAEDARSLGLTGESQDAERTMIEGALAANAPLAIACWRGRSSLAVLVSKPECSLLEEKLTQAIARAAARAEAPAPQQPQNDRPALAEKDGGYESDTEEAAAAAAAGAANPPALASPPHKRQRYDS
ncbi:hypothetical protein WJX74_001555 [Apatococcus lobatus]|uniref:SAM-dependent MTase RsmB/NOP-type domain-containing protein n=2 Tax=Apatococcus TaxID=904362 RepID=A0AAW1TDI9_9CHLO